MRWTDKEDIVQALSDEYVDIHPDDITLQDLLELVVDLRDFSDDPDRVNTSQLKELLELWQEKINYPSHSGREQKSAII